MSAGALLGFAQKAGKVVSGYTAVIRAIGAHRAKLIVVAGDASSRTREGVERAAQGRRIPVVTWGSVAELGKAIGKPDRAVVAVCDSGFAQALLERLPGGGAEKGQGDVHDESASLRVGEGSQRREQGTRGFPE